MEFSELSTKLADLRNKLADQNAVRSEHESAIVSARSKCDEYTKSDVSKLQRRFRIALASRSKRVETDL